MDSGWRKVAPKASSACLPLLRITLQHPSSLGLLLMTYLILSCGHNDEGKCRWDRDALAVHQAPHAGMLACWEQHCPATA